MHFAAIAILVPLPQLIFLHISSPCIIYLTFTYLTSTHFTLPYLTVHFLFSTYLAFETASLNCPRVAVSKNLLFRHLFLHNMIYSTYRTLIPPPISSPLSKHHIRVVHSISISISAHTFYLYSHSLSLLTHTLPLSYLPAIYQYPHSERC